MLSAIRSLGVRVSLWSRETFDMLVALAFVGAWLVLWFGE